MRKQLLYFMPAPADPSVYKHAGPYDPMASSNPATGSKQHTIEKMFRWHSPNELAWVTLATNDTYALGALVLAHSLRKVRTVHELVVLITPGVSHAMRQQLQSVFGTVEEVDLMDSKDASNLALLARPDLGITFTKLHCWRLTQFDKCVFLDADTLVLQNCDELFEREELSAAPDAGWPDCFNSGVFVYKPSNETFSELLGFALEHGSFDGGDQGLLNMFFKDWATKDINKHLPFIYNLCSTATYSYLPAFKFFGGEAKIVHFIGSSKPWLLVGSASASISSFLQYWWDLFQAHVSTHLTADMSLQRPSSCYVCSTASSQTDPSVQYAPNVDSANSAVQVLSYIFTDPWETLKNRGELDRPLGTPRKFFVHKTQHLGTNGLSTAQRCIQDSVENTPEIPPQTCTNFNQPHTSKSVTSIPSSVHYLSSSAPPLNPETHHVGTSDAHTKQINKQDSIENIPETNFNQSHSPKSTVSIPSPTHCLSSSASSNPSTPSNPPPAEREHIGTTETQLSEQDSIENIPDTNFIRSHSPKSITSISSPTHCLSSSASSSNYCASPPFPPTPKTQHLKNIEMLTKQISKQYSKGNNPETNQTHSSINKISSPAHKFPFGSGPDNRATPTKPSHSFSPKVTYTYKTPRTMNESPRILMSSSPPVHYSDEAQTVRQYQTDIVGKKETGLRKYLVSLPTKALPKQRNSPSPACVTETRKFDRKEEQSVVEEGKKHSSVPRNTGFAGALGGGGKTAVEDHWHRQNWEQGNIDYLGKDSFDNIWRKISETISTSPPRPSPERQSRTPPAQPTKAEAPIVPKSEAIVEQSAPVKQQTPPPKPKPAPPASEEKPPPEPKPAPPVSEVKPAPPPPPAPKSKPSPPAPEKKPAPILKTSQPKPATPPPEPKPVPAPPAPKAAPIAPGPKSAPTAPEPKPVAAAPESKPAPKPKQVPVAPESKPSAAAPEPIMTPPLSEPKQAPPTPKHEVKPAPKPETVPKSPHQSPTGQQPPPLKVQKGMKVSTSKQTPPGSPQPKTPTKEPLTPPASPKGVDIKPATPATPTITAPTPPMSPASPPTAESPLAKHQAAAAAAAEPQTPPPATTSSGDVPVPPKRKGGKVSQEKKAPIGKGKK